MPMRSFAIIPAAGRSRRMGEPKLLLPWGASTVIEHVLAAWRASRVDNVVVVLHRDDHRLAELCAERGAIVSAPETPPPQMKDSVRCGLDLVAGTCQPQDDDAWLVAPADMPGLSTAVIDRLIEAHAAELNQHSGHRPIRAARYGAKPGHPVLFPWPLAAEVARLGDNEGLDVLVARLGVEYVDFALQANPEDFDTPADYERLRSRLDP
jgi:molybdenum cofactor cytidylyltransferase